MPADPPFEEEPGASVSPADWARAAGLFGVALAGFVYGVLRDRLSTVRREATGAASARSLPETASVPAGPEADVLVRMAADLRRAMAKPVEQRRWVMVIDTRKCVGCHACTIGCVAENQLPPGVVYRPVVTEEFGEFPHVGRRFWPRPCMQCDNPPCVPVCPVNATWKRPDGIVAIDYDRCIGCRYCISACPYGARTSDYGHYYTEQTPEIQPYETVASYEYGKRWDRAQHGSPVGNARKCHFCLHRLEVGMLPVCVTTCIGRATYFGDANDPDSLVRELLSRPNQVRLLEEKGTQPRVVYLI